MKTCPETLNVCAITSCAGPRCALQTVDPSSLWYKAASPYATPGALREALERLRAELAQTRFRAEEYHARIGELFAERERLRAELARISEEIGLPPTIGPAPGELKRMLDQGRDALADASRYRRLAALVEDGTLEGSILICRKLIS